MLLLGIFVGIVFFIKDNGVYERIFKNGDIMLGGIFFFYLVKNSDFCLDFCLNMLILLEVMIYVVDEIIKDGKIL